MKLEIASKNEIIYSEFYKRPLIFIDMVIDDSMNKPSLDAWYLDTKDMRIVRDVAPGHGTNKFIGTADITIKGSYSTFDIPR